MKGVLKWYNKVKGYGFIETGEGDVFFHYNALTCDKKQQRTLHTRPGASVEIDVEKSERGLKATRVVLVEPEKV